MTENDVVGIGNAIVDIIGRCDEAFLARHGAAKGHMRLVDEATVTARYAGMGPAIEISGGSAANTMVGLASFGGNAAFIGKVADDEFGRIFKHDIAAAGVTFQTPPVQGKAPTSRSLILVTPDGERTMNTYLGISTDLDHGEVDAALIEKAGIIYLEGYLFDQPQAKAAFRQAVSIANRAGCKVALTLSDGFCVDRHRTEFLDLIRSGVGILFANESEIASLYETTNFDEAARRAAAGVEPLPQAGGEMRRGIGIAVERHGRDGIVPRDLRVVPGRHARVDAVRTQRREEHVLVDVGLRQRPAHAWP